MTDMTIIELALEAGFDPHDMSADFTCNLRDIERFATMAAKRDEALLRQALEKFERLDGWLKSRYWGTAGLMPDERELIAALRERLGEQA